MFKKMVKIILSLLITVSIVYVNLNLINADEIQKYTVTLNANGGKFKIIDNGTDKEVDEIILEVPKDTSLKTIFEGDSKKSIDPMVEKPTRDGFELFSLWKTDSNIAFYYEEPFDENIKLSALWSPNSGGKDLDIKKINVFTKYVEYEGTSIGDTLVFYVEPLEKEDVTDAYFKDLIVEDKILQGYENLFFEVDRVTYRAPLAEYDNPYPGTEPRVPRHGGMEGFLSTHLFPLYSDYTFEYKDSDGNWKYVEGKEVYDELFAKIDENTSFWLEGYNIETKKMQVWAKNNISIEKENRYWSFDNDIPEYEDVTKQTVAEKVVYTSVDLKNSLDAVLNDPSKVKGALSEETLKTLGVDSTKMKVVAEPKLKMDVTEITIDSNDNIDGFTVDITPVYTLKVQSKDDDTNYVVLVKDEELEVKDNATVKISLPDSENFKEGSKVWVKHKGKAFGGAEGLTVMYDEETGLYIQFDNPDGFSPFQVSASRLYDDTPTPKPAPAYVAPKTGIE